MTTIGLMLLVIDRCLSNNRKEEIVYFEVYPPAKSMTHISP
jgi:hypothetical protein